MSNTKTVGRSVYKARSLDNLQILSPKLSRKTQAGWEGFFPYYAGYPETFAHAVLDSARLPAGAVVLDPWNGSGTTTLAASRLGLTARGLDLNPVMVIVARARLLPPSEADHLKPLATAVLPAARAGSVPVAEADPLLDWFEPAGAAAIRMIERNIASTLLGDRAITPAGVQLDQVSGTTATLYMALFSACRRLVQRFMSSNPTWLRRPRSSEDRIRTSAAEIGQLFKESVAAMADVLAHMAVQGELPLKSATYEIMLADTTSFSLARSSVDFILTSPPYCTRIDYTAATRIELAVLDPLVSLNPRELGQRMIGSTRVPDREVKPADNWGPTCLRFLEELRTHRSKASGTYYYKTHLDYFDKMATSIANLAEAVKPSGVVIFVIQDSHYKEIHNDLPTIISELASTMNLALVRRENFHLKNPKVSIHPHSRRYGRPQGAIEAVLCFQKSGQASHETAA